MSRKTPWLRREASERLFPIKTCTERELGLEIVSLSLESKSGNRKAEASRSTQEIALEDFCYRIGKTQL